MNKKAFIQWFTDLFLAILIVAAFSIFTFYIYGGYTRQIEAKVLDFGEFIDTQTFLQGLLRTPVQVDNFNGNTADLLALSIYNDDYENAISDILKKNLDSKYGAGSWDFSVRDSSSNYDETYGRLYLLETVSEAGATSVDISAKVASVQFDPSNYVIPSSPGDYFRLKVWPFKTLIPSLDGKNVEILLRLRKDE